MKHPILYSLNSRCRINYSAFIYYNIFNGNEYKIFGSPCKGYIKAIKKFTGFKYNAYYVMPFVLI